MIGNNRQRPDPEEIPKRWFHTWRKHIRAKTTRKALGIKEARFASDPQENVRTSFVAKGESSKPKEVTHANFESGVARVTDIEFDTMPVGLDNSHQRYHEAKQRMQHILSRSTNILNSSLELTLPDLEILTVDEAAAALEAGIDSLIRETGMKAKNLTRTQKAAEIVSRSFRVIGPVVKNFLIVAKEGQSVSDVLALLTAWQIPVLNPYGLLCGGLMLLIKVDSPINSYISCSSPKRTLNGSNPSITSWPIFIISLDVFRS